MALHVADLGSSRACKAYLDDFSEEKRPGEPFLTTAVGISLAALQKKNDQNRTRHEYSVSGMHVGLCFLEEQQLAPVAVLPRMWSMDEASARTSCAELDSLSLCTMSSRTVHDGSEEDEIVLCDVLFEYCRDVAEQSGDMTIWHRRLLDGFAVPDPISFIED